MGTLSDALAPHAARIANQPRVYVDANMPAGLVEFMRSRLKWDVLFVIEHDDLRRAHDDEHYVMARQLRRTLITLDRDYLDDRRFPPAESGGVLVLAAPDHRGVINLLTRLDQKVFRVVDDAPRSSMPLAGRKLHLHVDWAGDQTVSR
jgi:hypothetical protein